MPRDGKKKDKGGQCVTPKSTTPVQYQGRNKTEAEVQHAHILDYPSLFHAYIAKNQLL